MSPEKANEVSLNRLHNCNKGLPEVNWSEVVLAEPNFGLDRRPKTECAQPSVSCYSPRQGGPEDSNWASLESQQR